MSKKLAGNAVKDDLPMRIIAEAIWDALKDFGAMAAIVLECVVAAMVYGVLHDQITTRVCLAYFTVWHEPILPHWLDPQSPTHQAFFWGITSTWWMGMFIGVLLSIAARVGSAPALAARDVRKPLVVLLIVMATCALLAGGIGYFFGNALADSELRQYVMMHISNPNDPNLRGFFFDLWAHNASYLIGAVGGIALTAHTAWRRWKKQRAVNPVS